MAVEVWQAESDWAESLGGHAEVSRKEVLLLLQALGFSQQATGSEPTRQDRVPATTRKSSAGNGASPPLTKRVSKPTRKPSMTEIKPAAPEPAKPKDRSTTTGPGLGRVVPLCSFLLASSGKAPDLIVPRIVECLQFVEIGVGHAAFSLHKSMRKKQDLVLQVMESLTRVITMDSLLLPFKTQLSTACHRLVKAMVEQLPLMDSGGDVSTPDTQITLALEFLDVVQQSLVAYLHMWPYPRLPLLPHHAQDLVDWWLKKVVSRGEVDMMTSEAAEFSLVLRLINECVQSGHTLDINALNQVTSMLIKGMYGDMAPVLQFSGWSSRMRTDSDDSKASNGPGTAPPKKKYAPPASYVAASTSLLAMLCYVTSKEGGGSSGDMLVDSMQLLLQLTEGYMALAVEADSQAALVAKDGGQTTGDVYDGCCAVLIPLWRIMQLAATINPPELLDGIERLELVVMKAAGLYGKEANNLEAWRWDMEKDIFTPDGPPTAEHVFRGVLHAWCGSMSCSWQAGHQGPVLSTLVGLLDAQALVAREASEQKSVMLAVGCLVVALKGEEGVYRLAVQFMIDLFNQKEPQLKPKVYGMAIYVTAVIVVQMAKYDSGAATTTQVGSVLLKLYKSPSHPVSKLLASGGPSEGALAHAFRIIAVGLQQCKVAVRAAFRQSMLQLFCDVAMAMPASPDAAAARRFGSLLPVLAAASLDLTIDLHGILTAPSGSTQAVEELVNTDAAVIRLYRLFWLVCAIYNFGGKGKNMEKWTTEWRESLGIIASRSPPLILGGAVASHQFDKIDERLDSDLHEPLHRLGDQGSHANLSAALLRVLAGTNVKPPASLTRARLAYLLSIAHHNLCRAELAPLPDTGDLFPLAGLMASLQVMDPTARDYPYMTAIVQQTFKMYEKRWLDTQLSASSAYALPTQADVAVVLVNNMCSGNTSSAVSQLASSLLHTQLRDVEALRWNKQLLTALIQHLGDAGDGAGDRQRGGGGGGQTLAHIRQVLQDAAAIAPHYTSSLVQEQMKVTFNDVSTALSVAAPLLTVSKAGKQASPHTTELDGFHTVIRKSYFEGRVSGLAGTIQVKGGQPEEAVVSEVMENLNSALEKKVAPEVLAERYLEGVCSVIMFPLASRVNDMLHKVAWMPAVVFSQNMVQKAVFGWNWIMSVAVSTTQVTMLCEIANSWVVTVDQQKGLFDVSFDPTLFEQSTGGDPDLVATGTDDFGQPRSVVGGITAHSVWLGFLQEMWEIYSRGKDAASVCVVHAFQHILQESLREPDCLSYHPASVGLRFRLLSLALRFCSFIKKAGGNDTAPPQIRLLYERILRTALAWFAYPVTWYGRWPEHAARGEATAVDEFSKLMTAMGDWPDSGPRKGGVIHPVWGTASASSKELKSLLQLLLGVEYERLRAWAMPRQDAHNENYLHRTTEQWKTTTLTAWEVNPRIALSLAARFPCVDAIQQELRQLMIKNAANPGLQEIPDAAVYLADAGTRVPTCDALAYLARWAPLPLLVALDMMSNEAGKNLRVREYALRSMRSVPPEQVAFFLPQLVQLLRGDQGGLIADFLVDRAKHSIVFADHLVCLLKSEGKPPEEAFNPAVKRSGWQPPADTGLWSIADALVERVWREMPQDIETYLKEQIGFFDEVTAISGKLYPVPKDQRKNKAVEYAGQLVIPRNDLFIPTNPETRVKAVIPQSATPMRSAAKVPILVAFKVDLKHEEGPPQEKVQACIFKVGDDIRQDVLALQVIGLLKDAFQKAGLDLYLCPYGTLPTGYEQGIIECVPNATSRAEYGDIADGGLYEIYQRIFGAPGTERFESARENFLKSEAGYAIASYLLWAKDRHGGNLMFNNEGHLIHIDFGFILGISPGGNLGFENAPFKLNHEMVQLIDPGGTKNSELYHKFVDLCVRGFLAARSIAFGIIATVSMMSDSGLPCYGYGQPIKSLRDRFHLELTDGQAAQCMRQLVDSAYNKWTTGLYDYIQFLQNKIPK